MPKHRPIFSGPRHDPYQDQQSSPMILPGISPEQFIQVQREHIKKQYATNDDKQEPWRKLPEIPSSAEVMASASDPLAGSGQDHPLDGDAGDAIVPILPHNIVNGPWPNSMEYIGTHYQLLREDGVASLREAVAQVRANPMLYDDRSTCVYTHVHIIGCKFSNWGPAIRIEFSTERSTKQIPWKHSKRLQQGTIVALSPKKDHFRSICKVAVVGGRSLRDLECNPPRIDLLWGDMREADLDPMEEYLMVESRSGYFEAYRHVLVAMQKLATESFPMSAHLTALDRSIAAPSYVEEQPFRDLNILAQQPNTKMEETITSNTVPENVDLLENMTPTVVSGDEILDNVNILEQWPNINTSSLDHSQMTALKRILTKKVAIVQGPPGTGKTFVSVTALKIMLSNWSDGDPPIIVAAQTNHALDQILLHLAEIEPNFIRLGGRTSNEKIKQRSLFEVKQNAPRGALPPFANMKNARKILDMQGDVLAANIYRMMDQGPEEMQHLLELGVITQKQFDSLNDDEWVEAESSETDKAESRLASWLGTDLTRQIPRCPILNMGFKEEEALDLDFEEAEENESEVKVAEDDDVDALQGKTVDIRETFTGRATGVSEKSIKRLLASTEDLWSIPLGRRGDIYRYFRHRIKKIMLETFKANVVQYMCCAENVKLARWQTDATFIGRTRVKLIGCTTTGLSKYRGLLASLKPRILLIEEAAETLEGTILAAMFESLQHLVLVGDHQQLPAHCTIHRLDQPPYSLAMSMFERLVNNGIEFTMLNKQRRMIPELRKLLNPFYPDLQDHPFVEDRESNRKPVQGMGGKDVFFFHHDGWMDQRDEDSSYLNRAEAEMLVKFFVYLNFNGIEQEKITILTFYNGQRKHLLQLMKKTKDLQGQKFNVCTVDAYQGEENDIILLSLVRSNHEKNIGFLESRNRTVVALSRARRGMYIFGDFVALMYRSPDLWLPVLKVLPPVSINGNGGGLPITCSAHGDETQICAPHEWEGNHGGCMLKCDGELPCGHPCRYNCHPFSHDKIACHEPCMKILHCKHQCTAKCGEECACECTQQLLQYSDEENEFYRPKPDKFSVNGLKKALPQGSPNQVSEDDVSGIFEEPNLDDVLGDKPKKSPQKQRVARYGTRPNSGASSPSHWSRPPPVKQTSPNHPAPTTPGKRSSPSAWKSFNAIKEDRNQELSLAKQRELTPSKKGPVYKETHRQVIVAEGIRKPDRTETRVIGDEQLENGVTAPSLPTRGVENAKPKKKLGQIQEQHSKEQPLVPDLDLSDVEVAPLPTNNRQSLQSIGDRQQWPLLTPNPRVSMSRRFRGDDLISLDEN